ncbi:DMT family transporter [Variovorax sp. H27-G14]|uniref:DMT family transporter n=1 Tax=Variovorax sp. H27-G14 TaxID=3111914 RepID=UPI0038FCCE7D
MNFILFPVAFAAGIGIALQTTLNAQLAKAIGGNSIIAAFFSFTTGALLLGIVALFRADGFESMRGIFKQPLWMLLGGVLGACALLCYVLLTPKIGLTLLIGLAIAGQLSSSMVIDHFSLFGVAQRPVTIMKLGGFVLMLAGLAVTLLSERFK